MTGRDHDVKYDFLGMQKQLINQFINGKPLINLEKPLVVYREDIQNIDDFTLIRRKISPQVIAYIILPLMYEMYNFKPFHRRNC